MQTDITEALRTLVDAACGRAFFWDNIAVPGRGFRLVERVNIDASMDVDGVTRFYVQAFAPDHANTLLSGMADSLADAVIAAHSALAALPLVADVELYAPAIITPANDATPDAPAVEVA